MEGCGRKVEQFSMGDCSPEMYKVRIDTRECTKSLP